MLLTGMACVQHPMATQGLPRRPRPLQHPATLWRSCTAPQNLHSQVGFQHLDCFLTLCCAAFADGMCANEYCACVCVCVCISPSKPMGLAVRALCDCAVRCSWTLHNNRSATSAATVLTQVVDVARPRHALPPVGCGDCAAQHKEVQL